MSDQVGGIAAPVVDRNGEVGLGVVLAASVARVIASREEWMVMVKEVAAE